MQQNVINGPYSVKEVFGELPLAIIPLIENKEPRGLSNTSYDHEPSPILDFDVINDTHSLHATDERQHKVKPLRWIVSGLLFLTILVIGWYFDLIHINEFLP